MRLWLLLMMLMMMMTTLAQMQFSRCKVLVRVLPRCSDQRVTVEDEDNFFNEVSILSQLDHFNIVQLSGYVVSSRPFMIVTRLSAVTCLRHYLIHATDSDAPDRPHHLLQICRQMATAVAYLADRRYTSIEKEITRKWE